MVQLNELATRGALLPYLEFSVSLCVFEAELKVFETLQLPSGQAEGRRAFIHLCLGLAEKCGSYNTEMRWLILKAHQQ